MARSADFICSALLSFLMRERIINGTCVSESEGYSVASNSLRPYGLYSPWNCPGQNTGVGSLCLLQGIFPTQRSNPGLPHCRQILYRLRHKGSSRILDWAAYLFSSRSSHPRNRTGVSCITGGLLSKGLSKVFSNTTVQKHQFFGALPSLHIQLTTVCDY